MSNKQAHERRQTSDCKRRFNHGAAARIDEGHEAAAGFASAVRSRGVELDFFCHPRSYGIFAQLAGWLATAAGLVGWLDTVSKILT